MPHALADALRDLPRLYNYAEVLIWPAMGLVLLTAAVRRRGVVRRDFALAGLVLLVFGATDYFEAENGNQWWTPWWLFLWKASCVAALLALLAVAWRRERRQRRSTAPVVPPVPVASPTAAAAPGAVAPPAGSPAAEPDAPA